MAWLNSNPRPDLIISDIELSDGNSFEIFRQVKITTPVIFTTAYNTYMQNAFKVNSIDYLLKPIDKEELKAAFEKYHGLSMRPYDPIHIDNLLAAFKNLSNSVANYKSRFLIKTGDRLSTIAVEEIAYLRADDRIVFLHTVKGQKHIIDDSLDDLEHMLDPGKFFRLNRRYMAPVNAIEKITSHFNGKLKVVLLGSDDSEIFVSKEKAATFKKWLDR
jgi:DNA-binding LytR/AlgR family response regulator